ncbi:unnamed protein product [Bubo scandiacus]
MADYCLGLILSSEAITTLASERIREYVLIPFLPPRPKIAAVALVMGIAVLCSELVPALHATRRGFL